MMSEANSTGLMYAGKPLLRKGDEIYYGDITEKFIAHLKFLSTATVGEVVVPTKVLIEILFTDPEIKGKGKVFRDGVRNSFAEALDLAIDWLNIAISMASGQ